jgi:hypothetical protein
VAVAAAGRLLGVLMPDPVFPGRRVRRLRFFVCLAMTMGGVAKGAACRRKPGKVLEYSVLERLFLGLRGERVLIVSSF